MKDDNKRTLINLIFILLLSTIYLLFNLDFLKGRDFFWDDLHFFRKYTSEQLISVFYSHWDPDLIETGGYRPLATLLYHLEFVFFNENVFYYRLFSLFLLIILQIIFSQIMINLNCDFLTQLSIHFLFFVSFSYSYMVIWSTMSHILLAAIFSLLTLRNIISYFRRKKIQSLIYAFLYLLIGLLLREEVYATALIIFTLGAVELYNSNFSFKAPFIKFVSGVFLLTSAHYFFRKIILTESSGFSQINITAFYDYLVFLVSSSMPGGLSTKDTTGIFLLTIFILFYITIGAKNFKYVIKNNRLMFWLGCSIIFSLPSLITSRVFSTFLPKLFIYVFVLEILTYQFRNYSFRRKFIAGTLIITLFSFSGIRRSLQLKESFSSTSVYMIKDNLRLVTDKRVTMPQSRRERYLEKYSDIKIPYLLLNEMDVDTRNKFFFDKILKLSKEKDSKYSVPLYHHLFL